MWRRTLIILMSTMVWMSCKKEKFPEEITGEPEFFVQGTIDGKPLLMEAGKDGYFMETFYSRDEQDIYSFGGEMRNLSSSESNGTLRFIIRGGDFPYNASYVDNSLQPAKYKIRNPSGIDTNYAVQFHALPKGNDSVNVDFNWSFGDSSFSSLKDPVHVYTNDQLSKYRVCLSANFNGGCGSDICSDIFLPKAPCSAEIKVEKNTPAFLTYEGMAEGTAPFRYEWVFNSTGQSALSQRVNYEYQSLPGPGVEQVCLTVTDANNCGSFVCYNVTFSNLTCAVNFNYTVEPVEEIDTTDYSTVIVEYIDNTGRLYTSYHDQPSDSFLEIISQHDYKEDRSGNKTKRISFASDVWLYSGQDAIKLTVSNGVIAVAHP